MLNLNSTMNMNVMMRGNRVGMVMLIVGRKS